MFNTRAKLKEAKQFVKDQLGEAFDEKIFTSAKNKARKWQEHAYGGTDWEEQENESGPLGQVLMNWYEESKNCKNDPNSFNRQTVMNYRGVRSRVRKWTKA